jgi:tetratricopeptide (TPR) repeat protein
MNRLPLLTLTVAAFGLLLGAAPPPSPRALLEQGDAALAAGDFTRAIELYEKAEPRTDEPGRVTFNLATAKYRRALRDKDRKAADLADAVQLYGCLLDKAEPYRRQALFGLANCLLEKAGDNDADLVLAAITAYEQCVDRATDGPLVTDARHNLELAKLLLLQIRKAEDEARSRPDQDPPNTEDPKNNKKPPPKPQGSQDPDHDRNHQGPGQKPSGSGDRTQKNPGDRATETDEPPPPGATRGLPTVPEGPDQPPLSAKDALEHLRQANERILRERHQHRLSIVKPPPEGVRDW